ncbi:hypothetical protein C8T65DRAFT_627192 [Cerioporus squamosus]|nr:hypothetical protein C8T65DRAFT_627192 [Cerioporus squamosus]
MAKQNGPKFARCNQCKLVFKDANECGMHAALTRHKHKPSYFCTVCSMTFSKRKSRGNHIKTTGHVQKVPTTFAKVPANKLPAKTTTAATRSSSSSAAAPIASRLRPRPVASTSVARPVSEDSDSDTSDDEASSSKAPPPSSSTCTAYHRQFKDAAALADHRTMAHTKPAIQSQATAGATSHSEGAESSPSQPAAMRTNDELQDAATPTPTERETTRCAKCDVEFSSDEALQAHYDESSLHPTCHTCGLGFASIGPWATHKARCPPPGSTLAANGDMNGRAPVGHSRTGKDIVRDMVPTAERCASYADSEHTSLPSPAEDPATAGNTSSSSLAAGIVEVSLERPANPQRAPSPTPFTAVSTTTISSQVHSSAQTIPQQSLLEDQAGRMHRVLHGERPEADGPLREPRKETPQLQDRATREAEAGSPIITDGSSTKGLTGAYMTPWSGRTRSETSIEPHSGWERAATQAARTSGPPMNGDSNATAVSFHCRSCLRDPCVQPVATICGHIFCHRCIVQELSTKMCCPVCQKTFFIRLHVEVD